MDKDIAKLFMKMYYSLQANCGNCKFWNASKDERNILSGVQVRSCTRVWPQQIHHYTWYCKLHELYKYEITEDIKEINNREIELLFKLIQKTHKEHLRIYNNSMHLIKLTKDKYAKETTDTEFSKS
jgi:hypothetical protein